MLEKLRRFFDGRPVSDVPPYGYVPGPRDLGIGVNNMALIQPGLPLSANQYAPGYNIKRNFEILSGGYGAPIPAYPETDLRGNGVYLSGDFALTGLVEFEPPSDSQ